MAYLVRRVDLSLWGQTIDNIEDLNGDTITTDLKTIDNTLSFWEVESKEMLMDISIALLTAGKHLDSNICLIIIPKSEIPKSLNFVNSIGSTAYVKCKNMHYDLVNVNIKSLKEVAELIMKYRDENVDYDIHNQTFKNKLKELIDNNEIAEENLQKNFKQEYNTHIESKKFSLK